jgi:hypothetical protein
MGNFAVVQVEEIRRAVVGFECSVRIPADADQHSWVIAITIPA